jgi:hypothetical protein
MEKRTQVAAVVAAIVALAACGGSYDNSVTTQPTVQASTKINYTANLTGGAEVPAVTSNGSGTFTGTLDPATKIMSYTVTFTGLGTTSILSHIHGPGTPAQAVGVIFNFQTAPTATVPFTPGATSGSYSGTVLLTSANQITTTVNGDSLLKLIDGGLSYVNVHSTQFPGGEIRGQIVKK